MGERPLGWRRQLRTVRLGDGGRCACLKVTGPRDALDGSAGGANKESRRRRHRRSGSGDRVEPAGQRAVSPSRQRLGHLAGRCECLTCRPNPALLQQSTCSRCTPCLTSPRHRVTVRPPRLLPLFHGRQASASRDIGNAILHLRLLVDVARCQRCPFPRHRDPRSRAVSGRQVDLSMTNLPNLYELAPGRRSR